MRQQIPKNQQKKQRTTELVEEFTIVRDGQRAFVTYYKLWSIHQKAQTVSPPPPTKVEIYCQLNERIALDDRHSKAYADALNLFY